MGLLNQNKNKIIFSKTPPVASESTAPSINVNNSEITKNHHQVFNYTDEKELLSILTNEVNPSVNQDTLVTTTELTTTLTSPATSTTTTNSTTEELENFDDATTTDDGSTEKRPKGLVNALKMIQVFCLWC